MIKLGKADAIDAVVQALQGLRKKVLCQSNSRMCISAFNAFHKRFIPCFKSGFLRAHRQLYCVAKIHAALIPMQSVSHRIQMLVGEVSMPQSKRNDLAISVRSPSQDSNTQTSSKNTVIGVVHSTLPCNSFCDVGFCRSVV